jgi:hypothetical protein
MKHSVRDACQTRRIHAVAIFNTGEQFGHDRFTVAKDGIVCPGKTEYLLGHDTDSSTADYNPGLRKFSDGTYQIRKVFDEELGAAHVIVIDVANGEADDVEAAACQFATQGRDWIGFEHEIEHLHPVSRLFDSPGNHACAEGHNGKGLIVTIGIDNKDVHIDLEFNRNVMKLIM